MKIEKGIPNPRPYRGFRTARSKYPFSEMDVGDSVFFEGQGNGGAAYAAAKKAGMRNGRKYSGYCMDGGIRIWRDA